MHLHIYTDGSQIKKPNTPPKTGYGFYIREWDVRKSQTLYGPNETNNRAELYAIADALETIVSNLPDKRSTPSYPSHVLIYTDSQYALQVIKKWILRPKEDIDIMAPNADLITRIRSGLAACKEHVPVEFIKVAAHGALSDDDAIGNFIADELANGAAQNSRDDIGTDGCPVFAFGKFKGMRVDIADGRYMDWLGNEWKQQTKWTQEGRIRDNIEAILRWKASAK